MNAKTPGTPSEERQENTELQMISSPLSDLGVLAFIPFC
jgi:hypothetical protein